MSSCKRILYAALACIASAAFAQDSSQPQTEASPVGGCSEHKGELGKFTIRSARVIDPFWVLRWRKLQPETVQAVASLKDQPYSFNAVNEVSKTVEADGWLPENPDARVEFAYSDIAVENCSADRKLDVVFVIFSVSVPPTLSSILEWRTKQVKAPNEATGISKENAPMQFRPEAGFDPNRGFFAGGSTRMALGAGAPFNILELRGVGSDASRVMSASLEGSRDSLTDRLGHMEWRLDIANNQMPLGTTGELRQSRLAGQFSGMTRPLGGAVIRFGGMLEGGNLQSSVDAALLPADTISSSKYTAAKVYVGITENWKRQAFAASFGLGLGSTGKTFHGGWRKLVGDVSHQLWLPAGEYRMFEFEQRLSAGGIQNLGSLPVAERFFGGNQDVNFIPGDAWRIRANPVIRSIPTNRLFLTGAGIGADRFVSYNTTTAWTAWGKPLVPEELRDDAQFQRLMKGAIVSQESILHVYHSTKDPRFAAIRRELPKLRAKLEQIKTARSGIEATAPASAKPALAACSGALRKSANAAKSADEAKAPTAFGFLPELINEEGIAPLAAVISLCGPELVNDLSGVSLPAPQLTLLSTELKALASELAVNFAAIDSGLAKQRAAADVKFLDRTLNIITNQMTITSISPVFVFDIARIGPAMAGPRSGNRYGVGGGVRFTLASTVSFTVGYAANLRSRPNEGKGALFFSLSTRNLFE